MASSRKSIFGATLPVDYVTKKCLLCLHLYHPQGIGDRVCPSCKETADWKKKSFGSTPTQYQKSLLFKLLKDPTTISIGLTVLCKIS